MNNRWVYLFTGMALLLFLGLIYAWSIFKAPFSEIYPQWSIPQLTLTFTISMIFFCLGGFWGGLLYKKIKAMIDPGQGDFRRERADCVFCNALPDTADRIVCHYIGLWSLQKSEN